MRYLKSFFFLSKADEEDFFLALKRTCYRTAYPFAIFPEKGLKKLEFEPVTILCGGNGSGKTTALNIIAESIGAKRVSPYNKSAFLRNTLRAASRSLTRGLLRLCAGNSINYSDVTAWFVEIVKQYDLSRRGCTMTAIPPAISWKKCRCRDSIWFAAYRARKRSPCPCRC